MSLLLCQQILKPSLEKVGRVAWVLLVCYSMFWHKTMELSKRDLDCFDFSRGRVVQFLAHPDP